MKRQREAVRAESEQPLGRTDSPYLTLDEASRFCRFDGCQRPVVSFRKWAHRHGLPFARRGRVLLVERRVLEAFLNGDDWTQRHGQSGPRQLVSKR